MTKAKKGINDLATLRPDLAAEWDTEANNGLLPSDVAIGSNKKVWWVCSRGHHYTCVIAKRTNRGQNCPICRKEERTLAVVHPEVLAFWDYERNTDISPNEVSYGSAREVWWKCEKGHSYQQPIHAKSCGYGCPVCAHQMLTEENCLPTINPRIASEWHPTKNGKITPYDVFPQTHKEAWWLCPYGHEYKAKIYTRKNSGCPICDSEKRTSFPEQALQFYLNTLFEVESRTKIGGFEADVYCPSIKVAIEYDGEFYHTGDASNIREEKKISFS